MKKNNFKMILMPIIFLSFSISGLLLALTIEDASIQELTIESDLIIRGKVSAIEYKWENQSLKKINTLIRINVGEYLKGEGKNDIEIVQMGGKIDDIEDIIFGTPQFKINDDVLLFLVFDNNKYVIHSIALGCYKIIIDKNQQQVAYNDLSNVNLISKDLNVELQNITVNKIYKISELYSEIKSNLK